MGKEVITVNGKTREELEEGKGCLLKKLENVEDSLRLLTNLEKPFVTVVHTYSGDKHYYTNFKTLEQAVKKFDEMVKKKRFKNGLIYGVYVFKYNQGGTEELLKSERKHKSFRMPEFL